MTNLQNSSHNRVKPEANLMFNQRITNTDLRLLAGANLDESHISNKIKKQLRSSTSCGKQLDINENNEMCRRYTCQRRFCRSCSRYMAFQRDLAFYPSINKIVQEHKRDSNHNAKLWLVTLTLPTCEAHELADRLTHMQKEWRYMYNVLKRNYNKAYCNGLRKLEINPNKKSDVDKATKHTDFLYHPHFHILIQGRGNAYALRDMWLKRHPKAFKGAQHVVRFDVKERQGGILCELLKYLAKPVVEGKGMFASRAYNKARAFVYDNLIGRRTIFSYGTVKKAKKYKFDIVNGNIVMQHGDEYELAFDESSKEMQDKLVRYINNEKSKASKSIENSMFEFINGMYVEAETGELLCTEKDIIESVKEQDRMAKERQKEQEEEDRKAKARGEKVKKSRTKKGRSTKLDAYKAERRMFEKTHAMRIGKEGETIESLSDELERTKREIKEKEEEYIYYKLHKKKDPTAEP